MQRLFDQPPAARRITAVMQACKQIGFVLVTLVAIMGLVVAGVAVATVPVLAGDVTSAVLDAQQRVLDADAALLDHVDRDAHGNHLAVVHFVVEAAVAQPTDRAAHAAFGVVLHVAHVGVHDVQAEMLDHAAQLLHALLVGGDLRAQVGERLHARILAHHDRARTHGGVEPDDLALAELLDNSGHLLRGQEMGRCRFAQARTSAASARMLLSHRRAAWALAKVCVASFSRSASRSRAICTNPALRAFSQPAICSALAFAAASRPLAMPARSCSSAISSRCRRSFAACSSRMPRRWSM